MSTPLTLAAIVDDQPAAARILERHRLDYCCGGQRTLDEACAEVGIDPAAVLADLEAVESSPAAEWTTMSAAELVDHLESVHHRYLHEEMPRLAELAAKVRSVHGGNHPELHQIADTYNRLRDELDPHLQKEERVLFPMIRELATAVDAPAFHCGSLGNPIRVMLMEHDQAGELMARLRELTDDYTPPADGCGSYKALFGGLAELEADTHLHIHKENNVLFPMVLALESELTAGS